jgi:hypothetical protein
MPSKAFYETISGNAQKISPNDSNHIDNEESLKPLKTVKMSDVEAKTTNFIWNPFIPDGTFVIIEGAEGEGKTYLVLAIATAVASGKGFPLMSFEDHIAPSNVIIMTAEDSLPHTIKPRLNSMNAPCERIIAVDEPFTLNKDGIFRLKMVIIEHNPKIIIIDPLFSYTGKINLDKDNEIRSVTSELIHLAETFECSIIGVRHIGKSRGNGDARNAGLNGIGWRASARSVLLVGSNPEKKEQKAVVHTKSNLSPICPKAIGYEIQNGQFYWTGESKLTAEQILSQPRHEEKRAQQSAAVAFLLEKLRDGTKLSNDLKSEAKTFGLTEQRLRTARKKLGVIVRKHAKSFDPKKHFWTWTLPNVNDNEDVSGNSDQHLRANHSDKTSYGNKLTEDVSNEQTQQLRATTSGQIKCWNCSELFQDSNVCPKCNTDQNKDIPF